MRYYTKEKLTQLGWLRLKSKGFGAGRWWQYKDTKGIWTTTYQEEVAIKEARLNYERTLPSDDITAFELLYDNYPQNILER